MIMMEANFNAGGQDLVCWNSSIYDPTPSFLQKKLFSQAGRADLVTKAGEEEWERLVIYISLILELNGV